MVAFLDGIIRFLTLGNPPAVPKGDPQPPTVPLSSDPVSRARRIAALRPTVYKLGAGGRSPTAETPFTVRDGVLGSDCIGFTCWASGIDRYQKDFPEYGHWINTDSAIIDSRSRKVFFEQVAVPQPGDWIVFPSVHRNGKMVRMGHVGLITEVPADWPEDWSWSRKDRRTWLSKLKQIDCNASAGRRLRKRAVAEEAASGNWDKPDAVFLRLRRH